MSVHGHAPAVGRRRLGRKAYGTGGDLWGTIVRCGCDGGYALPERWHEQVNQAPSQGGRAEAVHRWWAHVATELAALPAYRWSELSLRLRRQFRCEGYTVQGEECGARAVWRYGAEQASATVVLCTAHARLAGART